jgi:hypothetical protein
VAWYKKSHAASAEHGCDRDILLIPRVALAQATIAGHRSRRLVRCAPRWAGRGVQSGAHRQDARLRVVARDGPGADDRWCCAYGRDVNDAHAETIFFTARGGDSQEGRVSVNGVSLAAPFGAGGTSTLTYDVANQQELQVLILGGPGEAESGAAAGAWTSARTCTMCSAGTSPRRTRRTSIGPTAPPDCNPRRSPRRGWRAFT